MNGSTDECARGEAADDPPEAAEETCSRPVEVNRIPLLTLPLSPTGNELSSGNETPAFSLPPARNGHHGAVAHANTNGRQPVNGNPSGANGHPSHANGNGHSPAVNGNGHSAVNGSTGNGSTGNGSTGNGSTGNGKGRLPVLNGNGHTLAMSGHGHTAARNGSASRLNGLASAARSRTSNPRTRAFRKKFFPEATDREWNDWRWQSRHRIRTLEQFERMVRLSESEHDALVRGGAMLPVGITPYYMSLLDPEDADQPLRKTVVPTTNEFVRTVGEADDPLGEDGHSPVPGLVHRYPDRVLMLPLDFCSTYCRYCTRSRVVGHGEMVPSEARLNAIFEYLEQATQVRDVLVSGGDALALSDDKLDWILGRLRAIPHLEFVRIGTKMPAVLPQRITPELCRVLRKYHPLWMSVHFLHPDECTPESAKACGRLSDAGIPLGSQTVLLKGVNDCVETMKQLVHRLLLMRVRPYYLYQCDPISGSSHFRTPVEKGLEIIEGLRGHTTGYAVPTYVIDAPGGGGKIPLQPDYVIGREGDFLVLRNFEGKTYRYPDPVA